MIEIIFEEEKNIRIDSFLSEYFENISRNKLSTLIKNGDVLVNGNIIKPKYVLIYGDKITVNLKKLDISKLKPENLGIPIIYQDEHIAIINKPVGIISHPTEKIRTGTVVNFILEKFKNASTINGEERPGIVHRLDQNTTGLMIIALTDEAFLKLKDDFQTRNIIKKYRTIVFGDFSKNHYIIEKPISRSKKNRKLMAVDENGKYAKTEFFVLKSKNNFSYIDVILHTGRTHQIRVHLSNMGHPILGDTEYSNFSTKYSVKEQLLEAYYLKFNHPITNKTLEFMIEENPLIKKYNKLIFE